MHSAISYVRSNDWLCYRSNAAEQFAYSAKRKNTIPFCDVYNENPLTNRLIDVENGKSNKDSNVQQHKALQTGAKNAKFILCIYPSDERR